MSTQRRVFAAIFLITALLTCFAGAQGAAAAEGKNTTPFTCVENGGERDFSDAHCDKKVTPGTGQFGHVAIPVGTNTSVAIVNDGTKNGTKEATPSILKGTIAGIKSEIVCGTVSGEGTLTGEEPSAKVHRFKTKMNVKKSKCTVPKPALGCKVKEPIELSTNAESVEGLGAGKNEMGIEYLPAGEHFMSITLEGCIIAGTFNVDGTAIATGTPSPTERFAGATKSFTNAMTKETLKLAGNAAELEETTTVRMTNGQNPISFTTVT
jgi:hypothetical protein